MSLWSLEMYGFALDTLQDSHTVVVIGRIKGVFGWRGNFDYYFLDSKVSSTYITFMYNNKIPDVYYDQSVRIITIIAMVIR